MVVIHRTSAYDETAQPPWSTLTGPDAEA
jgi:hypothetical protein